MPITHNLTPVRLDELQNLLNFLARYTPQIGAAEFRFFPETLSAIVRCHGETLCQRDLPIVVVLQLTPLGRREYPCVEWYLDDLPPIEIHNWQEELLLVLAHECKHVQQFSIPYDDIKVDPVSMHQDEVEAELHAYAMLNAWRKALKKQPIKGTVNACTKEIQAWP